MTRFKQITILCAALCLGLLAGCGKAEVTAVAEEPTLYLVRHAEKADSGADPYLTKAGDARAQALANLLTGKNVYEIYSTNYARTRSTAEPFSKASGVRIQTYDPYDLEGLAERLIRADRNVLVVGHSNTTPQLAKALGGEPGTPIDDETEFNRLYKITLRHDGTVDTQISTYP